jgi:peptide/nickel transport system permease protein
MEAMNPTFQGELKGLGAIWYQFRKSTAGVLGLAVIILFVSIAIFAPQLTDYDPTAVSRDRLQAPSPTHFFGTDNVGKDVYSGVL